MGDQNSCHFTGRLTRDAELKYTTAGTAVCKFSIACDRDVKKDDKWEKEASFFDFTLWGKRGESLNQYLVKGTPITVDAEARLSRWEKDGQTHTKVDFSVTNIVLHGAKRQDGAGQAPANDAQPYQKRDTPASMDDSIPPDLPEGIPF